MKWSIFLLCLTASVFAGENKCTDTLSYYFKNNFNHAVFLEQAVPNDGICSLPKKILPHQTGLVVVDKNSEDYFAIDIANYRSKTQNKVIYRIMFIQSLNSFSAELYQDYIALSWKKKDNTKIYLCSNHEYVIHPLKLCDF